MSTAPSWYQKALTFVGQKEVHGAKSNPFVLKLWTLIRAPFTDDETPWCAGFVGGMFEMVGIKSTRAASARSYLKWGVPLTKPAVGAVMVFERGPTNGHVAFYVGEDKIAYAVLGGNQSDMVCITRIAKTRCIGIRWPADQPLPASGPVTTTAAGKLSTNEA